MKITLKYFLLATLFILCTCKKYDEGGLVRQTCKHLFGGSEDGDNKSWSLKLYEVNGIDSTNLIQGSDNLTDFINFKFIKANPSPEYSGSTKIHNYSGTIGKTYKNILFAYSWTNKEDSMQCRNGVCQRNIFVPEFLSGNPMWSIKKLSNKEFIISTQLTNSYKIILTQ